MIVDLTEVDTQYLRDFNSYWQGCVVKAAGCVATVVQYFPTRKVMLENVVNGDRFLANKFEALAPPLGFLNTSTGVVSLSKSTNRNTMIKGLNDHTIVMDVIAGHAPQSYSSLYVDVFVDKPDKKKLLANQEREGTALSSNIMVKRVMPNVDCFAVCVPKGKTVGLFVEGKYMPAIPHSARGIERIVKVLNENL